MPMQWRGGRSSHLWPSTGVESSGFLFFSLPCSCLFFGHCCSGNDVQAMPSIAKCTSWCSMAVHCEVGVTLLSAYAAPAIALVLSASAKRRALTSACALLALSGRTCGRTARHCGLCGCLPRCVCMRCWSAKQLLQLCCLMAQYSTMRDMALCLMSAADQFCSSAAASAHPLRCSSVIRLVR